MNNLIRKLADQVRFVSEPEYPDQYIIFEKFAKLIVRECLNELCEQMDKHHIDLSNLPSWYKALAQTEKHFGVEE